MQSQAPVVPVVDVALLDECDPVVVLVLVECVPVLVPVAVLAEEATLVVEVDVDVDVLVAVLVLTWMPVVPLVDVEIWMPDVPVVLLTCTPDEPDPEVPVVSVWAPVLPAPPDEAAAITCEGPAVWPHPAASTASTHACFSFRPIGNSGIERNRDISD